ncbi:hypothetical protein CsSME_00024790 [Camellia sinensis var. sinensis]
MLELKLLGCGVWEAFEPSLNGEASSECFLPEMLSIRSAVHWICKKSVPLVSPKQRKDLCNEQNIPFTSKARKAKCTLTSGSLLFYANSAAALYRLGDAERDMESKRRSKADGSDSNEENLSKKDLALQQAVDQITTSFGKGSVMWLGRSLSPKQVPVVSTGSFSLDIALGIGGLPKTE